MNINLCSEWDSRVGGNEDVRSALRGTERRGLEKGSKIASPAILHEKNLVGVGESLQAARQCVCTE